MKISHQEVWITDWQRDARQILKTLDKIKQFKDKPNEIDPEIYQKTLYHHLYTLSESADSIPQEIKNEYPKLNWFEIKEFQ